MTLAIWIVSSIGLTLAGTLAAAGFLMVSNRRTEPCHLPDESTKDDSTTPCRLSELANGDPVRIVRLDEACTGHARRRILDLGLTRGAPLRRELSGPFGGMSAYRIRGTLIALRNDQTYNIWVEAAQAN